MKMVDIYAHLWRPASRWLLCGCWTDTSPKSESAMAAGQPGHGCWTDTAPRTWVCYGYWTARLCLLDSQAIYRANKGQKNPIILEPILAPCWELKILSIRPPRGGHVGAKHSFFGRPYELRKPSPFVSYNIVAYVGCGL